MLFVKLPILAGRRAKSKKIFPSVGERSRDPIAQSRRTEKSIRYFWRTP
jgi:hypothetical protein